MLSCRDVTRLVASGESERVGPVVRGRLWLHLRMCRHCRDYRRQMAALGEAARDLARDLTTSAPGMEEAERRLLGAVREELGGR